MDIPIFTKANISLLYNRKYNNCFKVFDIKYLKYEFRLYIKEDYDQIVLPERTNEILTLLENDNNYEYFVLVDTLQLYNIEYSFLEIKEGVYINIILPNNILNNLKLYID